MDVPTARLRPVFFFQPPCLWLRLRFLVPDAEHGFTIELCACVLVVQRELRLSQFFFHAEFLVVSVISVWIFVAQSWLVCGMPNCPLARLRHGMPDLVLLLFWIPVVLRG